MIAIFEGVPSIFTSSWKVEVITTDLPTISAIQFFGRPWEIWEMEDFYTSPRITWPDILLLLSIYVNLCLYCVYLLNLYTYLLEWNILILMLIRIATSSHGRHCRAALTRRAPLWTVCHWREIAWGLTMRNNSVRVAANARPLCFKGNRINMLERGTWKSRRTWSCASRNGPKSVAAAGCFQWVSILMVLHQVHHVPVTQWQRSQLSQHVPAPTKRRQALQVLLLQQKLGHYAEFQRKPTADGFSKILHQLVTTDSDETLEIMGL